MTQCSYCKTSLGSSLLTTVSRFLLLSLAVKSVQALLTSLPINISQAVVELVCRSGIWMIDQSTAIHSVQSLYFFHDKFPLNILPFYILVALYDKLEGGINNKTPLTISQCGPEIKLFEFRFADHLLIKRDFDVQFSQQCQYQNTSHNSVQPEQHAPAPRKYSTALKTRLMMTGCS